MASSASELNHSVAEFWNREPCGTRYLPDGETGFNTHSESRYALEPYIPRLARFEESAGLRVLEIGVGMGADYEQWLKCGANATGIDLSEKSLAQAHQRCELAGLPHDLRVADAEKLPFSDCEFDVVYSYGVMHHSSDPERCIQEAWRVLKPGGEARIMLYHHPSLTGLMLWIRFGLWRGQSIRRSVFENLESPGTKTFTAKEVRRIFAGFEDLQIEQVFSPGDLLLHKPSSRFTSAGYRLIWKLLPRGVVRRIARRLGLFLLITARKPNAA